MPVIVGHDESVKKRITCHNCCAINEYMKSEIRNLWRGRDYGEGDAGGADGFNCDNCGKEVAIRRW